MSGPTRRVRRIREGETFTVDEDRAGLIERDDVDPDPDPPPENTRGEPWGWPDDEEHRDKPRGWPHAPRAWRDGENFDGSR
jgi:hypothetical protein